MADDAKRDWVIRVLGFTFAENTAAAPRDEDDATLSLTDLTERLQIINQDARASGVLGLLQEPLKAAAIGVKANANNAVELLEILEQRLADLAGSQRMTEVKDTAKNATESAKASLDGLAKMHVKLQAARSGFDTAVSNLEMSRDALLKHPQFANDPRSKELEFLKNADGVAERVPDIEIVASDVQKLLDDMATAADLQARQALAQQAVTIVKKYRSELTDPILTVMEKTPGGSFPILSLLSGVLDDLADALQA
jgi:hypothetical protein